MLITSTKMCLPVNTTFQRKHFRLHKCLHAASSPLNKATLGKKITLSTTKENQKGLCLALTKFGIV